VLNTAYAGGLLSEDTFVRRLDQLLGARLIDSFRLIGDLDLRTSANARHGPFIGAVIAAVRRVRVPWVPQVDGRAVLLALDWGGGQRELLIGRHRACDVVLSDPSVPAGMLACSFAMAVGYSRIWSPPTARSSMARQLAAASSAPGTAWFWGTSSCGSTDFAGHGRCRAPRRRLDSQRSPRHVIGAVRPTGPAVSCARCFKLSTGLAARWGSVSRDRNRYSLETPAARAAAPARPAAPF
jgi:hypothetical protein